ncbi:MAG: IS66 family transposase [Polyangiaceae bacterium]
MERDWQSELDARDREIAELKAQLAAALARIAELERLLAANSINSGKPPSTDDAATREERRKKRNRLKSERKRGARPGHKAKFRALVPPERVTRRHEHFPKECGRCNHHLPKQPSGDPSRHQVAEIPEIHPDVDEHLLHQVQCPCCGEVTRAKLPKRVPRGVFGPRLMAFVALLTGVYHLSRRDTASFLKQALDLDVSLGGISGIERRVSDALAPATKEATEHALDACAKHVDATGWRNAGRYRNLWTIATEAVTVFGITLDGSRKALRKLLSRAHGVLVSDRAGQFNFWAMQDRQICWAHLLRKFVEYSERGGEAGELGRGLVLLTQTLFHAIHKVRDGTISETEFRHLMANLGPHIEAKLERTAALKIRGVSRSCTNILEHREALWTFVDNPDVEPTNNHAERELRRFVLWRKRSFGSQSERGERYAERIMTVAHTLRKQKRSLLAFLTDTLKAQLRRKPHPSLLPARA